VDRRIPRLYTVGKYSGGSVSTTFTTSDIVTNLGGTTGMGGPMGGGGQMGGGQMGGEQPQNGVVREILNNL
jgi:hypothetical protein